MYNTHKMNRVITQYLLLARYSGHLSARLMQQRSQYHLPDLNSIYMEGEADKVI